MPTPSVARNSLIPCCGKFRVPSNSMCSTKCARPCWSSSSSTDPGLDDEPELGAPRRLGIRAHVIAQAVRQRADGDFGIDRHLLRERIGADRLRRRLAARRRALAGGRGPRGGEQGGHDTAEGNTNARESHMSILPDGRRFADGRHEIANFVSRQSRVQNCTSVHSSRPKSLRETSFLTAILQDCRARMLLGGRGRGACGQASPDISLLLALGPFAAAGRALDADQVPVPIAERARGAERVVAGRVSSVTT